MLDLFVRLFRPDFFARKFKGKNHAIILLYHSPEAEIFEQHVQYLIQYYNFISLQKLVDAICEREWSAIPPNALVFTFDDGHYLNYNLRATFKRYKITPTIYIVSGIVGTNRKFWWQEGLNPDEIESLMLLPNKERIKFVDNKKSLNNNACDLPSALTRLQIEEMSEIVDFQSHTTNHPIATMLDDEELDEELRTPIETLKEYGLEVKHFAYPNGDYASREIEYLKKIGYSSARTIDIGWNNKNSDPFRLKIMGISDDASIPKLKLQVSGIFGWIFHIIYSGNYIGKKKIITKTN